MADVALLCEAVPACHGQLGRIVAAHVALVLTHEDQEGARGADLVALACNLHRLEVAGEGHVREPQGVVEARGAVEPREEVAGAEDPDRLPELREGVAGGQEVGEDGDLREVDREPLVLAAAQAASVRVEKVAAKPGRRDVLRGLPLQAARHEVPADRAVRARRATSPGDLRDARHWRRAGVIVADAQVGALQAHTGGCCSHLGHSGGGEGLRSHQERALLSVLQRGVCRASGQKVRKGLAEVARAGAHLHKPGQATAVARRGGSQEGLGRDVTDLPAGVADPAAIAELVVAGLRPGEDHAIAAEGRRLQKVAVDEFNRGLHGKPKGLRPTLECQGERCRSALGPLRPGEGLGASIGDEA
mmetsp:Transcript_84827/g.225320  ORF Transcript_84827/g.225320 Transcript_84827/m.225320 type:complete len:360 (+) Transcript_84827:636-1715(+)